VAGYANDHDLPEHPLVSQGYLSIGCAPTTRPVSIGENPRAGRWADSDKVECGLHA
jgi:phosphoadenosine phosphosulfate reductase